MSLDSREAKEISRNLYVQNKWQPEMESAIKKGNEKFIYKKLFKKNELGQIIPLKKDKFNLITELLSFALQQYELTARDNTKAIRKISNIVHHLVCAIILKDSTQLTAQLLDQLSPLKFVNPMDFLMTNKHMGLILIGELHRLFKEFGKQNKPSILLSKGETASGINLSNFRLFRGWEDEGLKELLRGKKTEKDRLAAAIQKLDLAFKQEEKTNTHFKPPELKPGEKKELTLKASHTGIPSTLSPLKKVEKGTEINSVRGQPKFSRPSQSGFYSEKKPDKKGIKANQEKSTNSDVSIQPLNR